MVINKYLDLVMLMILILVFVFEMPAYSIELSTPIVSSERDKSMVKSDDGTLNVGHNDKTGTDLLLMLSVVDEYTPYPRSIRINDTPIIDLDDLWIAHRDTNLKQVYSTTGSWKLGSMLNWKVTSIEYVENAGDPYIQYRLENI